MQKATKEFALLKVFFQFANGTSDWLFTWKLYMAIKKLLIIVAIKLTKNMV